MVRGEEVNVYHFKDWRRVRDMLLFTEGDIFCEAIGEADRRFSLSACLAWMRDEGRKRLEECARMETQEGFEACITALRYDVARRIAEEDLAEELTKPETSPVWEHFLEILEKRANGVAEHYGVRHKVV